jgi:alkanesulfonate monooxygenase SsuD/methylene tetrahydromethanopterin reductase-like flavin-dependent oxidoreductase (luciferase family)
MSNVSFGSIWNRWLIDNGFSHREGRGMNYGINLATAADSWKVVKRAEELGFTRAWFYDTQLLNAEIFVAMGAAAVTTSRIRLGTGVLIPSNRIAPVAASALMSLNALAPGRIDFGISTGFTARRTGRPSRDHRLAQPGRAGTVRQSRSRRSAGTLASGGAIPQDLRAP